MNYLRSFWHDEQGAELAEYAVGTAILVAVAIIVYKVLGDAVNVKMSTVANEVQKYIWSRPDQSIPRAELNNADSA